MNEGGEVKTPSPEQQRLTAIVGGLVSRVNAAPEDEQQMLSEQIEALEPSADADAQKIITAKNKLGIPLSDFLFFLKATNNPRFSEVRGTMLHGIQEKVATSISEVPANEESKRAFLQEQQAVLENPEGDPYQLILAGALLQLSPDDLVGYLEHADTPHPLAQRVKRLLEGSQAELQHWESVMRALPHVAEATSSGVQALSPEEKGEFVKFIKALTDAQSSDAAFVAAKDGLTKLGVPLESNELLALVPTERRKALRALLGEDTSADEGQEEEVVTLPDELQRDEVAELKATLDEIAAMPLDTPEQRDAAKPKLTEAEKHMHVFEHGEGKALLKSLTGFALLYLLMMFVQFFNLQIKIGGGGSKGR